MTRNRLGRWEQVRNTRTAKLYRKPTIRGRVAAAISVGLLRLNARRRFELAATLIGKSALILELED
jgi:hypothetical protein